MENDIKQARKSGGSVILPLTGYIEDGKYYKVSKVDNMIVLKEAKIVVDE